MLNAEEKNTEENPPEQSAAGQSKIFKTLRTLSQEDLLKIGRQRYRKSEQKLFHNLFDLQGRVIYFHDSHWTTQLDNERLERTTESRFINKCGGRLQLSVNPFFVSKQKCLRSKVNLIVCRWSDYKRVVG